MELQEIIEQAWENRELLRERKTEIAIKTIIEEVDKGLRRVATPLENGEWQINEWIKKAIILYFPIQQM